MRNDSSLTYNTDYSRIQNFRDFESEIQKGNDEMKSIKRNFKKNKDGGDDLANLDSDKLKYNKITHKTDNNFGKELVSDFIDELESDEKEPSHKFKMETTQDKAKMESYQEFVQKKMMSDHGNNHQDMMVGSNYSDGSDVTSYMFFGNLQTLHRLSEEILQMDESKINQSLNDGHNWAEDHITTAKVQVSQVHNFLMNEQGGHHNENNGYNYMFFANLETICEQCENMLQLDESMVDELLTTEHDWAEDHITSAKENIEQVHEFLKNELK